MFRFLFVASLFASLVFAGLPAGRPLPDVQVLQPSGKAIDLKQFRGKPLLIAIVSTTCDDCKEMMALLKKVHQENSAKGLQTIAVVVEPASKYTTSSFAGEQKPGFPVGYLELEAYQKLVALPPGKGANVPILLFVDGKGMVRVQFWGDDRLIKKDTNLKTPDLTVRGTVRELIATTQQKQ